MSIVLPVAMIAATTLGAIGIGLGFVGTDVKGSIKLASGQSIYVGTEVRLNQAKKEGFPDSCLNTMGNGRVTSIDEDKRTVTFVCRKGGRAISETILADALDVVSSGINASGIAIPGGYLIEGSRVRLLQSARAKNRGKGLASPFANAVGVVTHLNPKRLTEVMVRTERIDNSKGSFEENYQVEDLEFVSGPSEPGKRGIKGGTIGIGSTVQLKLGPDGKIDPEIKKKHANGFFTKGSESYRLTGEKAKDGMGITREWETFGVVTRVLTDPKTNKDFATVRCVSKDSSKSVVEEEYELNELEAVPARSVPRPGIPVFGGMANNDIKVRLRAERKEAVASKPLGRAAFGDEGTVVDIQPEDKDNLQVLVVCNGKNPEELTKEWYEPEDLEVAEPDDTEGEPVFGGRVTVGSLVRVRQSARGKKCLGTMEVGDVGAVKGIDPNGADNMKINVTCGRSLNAKKSEWYDPRDLELFFATEDAGTPLAKAQSELLEAQRTLNDLKSRQEAPTSKSIQEQEAAEEAVKKAQEKVDVLTGQSLDMTKATEVYKNTKEKLESALKLKRDTEELRLKAAKETTCQQDPYRGKAYSDQRNTIVDLWRAAMRIPNPAGDDNGNNKSSNLKPIQGSESFKNVWKTLYQHFKILDSITSIDEPTKTAFLALQNARVKLKTLLENKERSTEYGFTGLDEVLKQVSEATVKYEKISTEGNQFKAAIETVERDIRKLQEVTSDLLASAYSGDTPTEKLLTRINDLNKEKEIEREEKSKTLEDKSKAYFDKLEGESVAWYKYRAAKDKYEYAFRNENIKTTNPSSSATGATGATGAAPPTGGANIEQLLKNSVTELKNYFTARMDTVKAKKAEAIASAESACLEIALESISEMKEKVEKAVTDKCKILNNVETLVDDIDTLISERQRAFLAARIAIDPTAADPANAKFAVEVNGDFAGRIELINVSSEALNTNPTIANLQNLVNLCGSYTGDTILDEVKAYIAKYSTKKPRNVVGGVDLKYVRERLAAAKNLQKVRNESAANKAVRDARTAEANARAEASRKEADNAVTTASRASEVSAIAATEAAAAAERERLAAEQRAVEEAAAAQQTTWNPDYSSPRTTRRVAVKKRTLPTPPPPSAPPPDPEPAPARLSRISRQTAFREASPAPPPPPPPPVVPSVAPESREIQTDSEPESPVTIKELGEKLAKDQILRLKSRTSGRNVILQLAQDVTGDADKTVRTILDNRDAFQFSVSKLNDIDFNVSGAVDFYETETSKLKTCISTRKAAAIEQYDREIADLDKQKKELVTSKTFEVQKQQQGQPGQQGGPGRKARDIKSIREIDQELRDPKLQPSRKEALISQKKFLQQNPSQNTDNNSPTSGGNRRHRFTVRQPRRFHGY
jgi:hypothetical protein